MSTLLYWLATGALLGFGLAGVYSTGMPMLLAGVLLLLYARYKKLSTEHMWVSLAALGLVPGSMMALSYAQANTPGTYFPEVYPLIFGLYLLVGLAGLAWGAAQLMRSKRA